MRFRLRIGQMIGRRVQVYDYRRTNQRRIESRVHHGRRHRAGFNCALREFDYGIDGTFIEVADMAGGGKVESGFKLDFQAKASIRATRANGTIRYPLEAEAFNRLVAQQRLSLSMSRGGDGSSPTAVG